LVLVDKGVSPAAIDSAMRRWGMAWGPCATLDTVGLDVVLATLGELAFTLGDQFDPPASLTRLVLRGDYGRKTEGGRYRYRRGGARPQTICGTRTLHESLIVKRLVFR